MLNKVGTQKERNTFEFLEITNLIRGPSKCKVSTETCSEKAQRQIDSCILPNLRNHFCSYILCIHNIFVYLENKKNF